jgi:hypothetical protein
VNEKGLSPNTVKEFVQINFLSYSTALSGKFPESYILHMASCFVNSFFEFLIFFGPCLAGLPKELYKERSLKHW